MKMKKLKKNKVWPGIPASPGIAIGKAYLLNREEIKINEENLVEGSGILKLFDKDTLPSLYDLLVMMLTISDNSATNQIVDEIGCEVDIRKNTTM